MNVPHTGFTRIIGCCVYTTRSMAPSLAPARSRFEGVLTLSMVLRYRPDSMLC
jgi:hypothetical protein